MCAPAPACVVEVGEKGGGQWRGTSVPIMQYDLPAPVCPYLPISATLHWRVSVCTASTHVGTKSALCAVSISIQIPTASVRPSVQPAPVPAVRATAWRGDARARRAAFVRGVHSVQRRTHAKIVALYPIAALSINAGPRSAKIRSYI